MKKKTQNKQGEEKSPKKTAKPKKRAEKAKGAEKRREGQKDGQKKKKKKPLKAQEKEEKQKGAPRGEAHALEERILTLFDACATLYVKKKESPLPVLGITLTPSEIHTLTAVKEIEPATLTALAAALGITKTGASKNAGKLIEKGLAKKEILSRCVLYTLTDKGEGMLTHLPDAQALVFIRFTDTVRMGLSLSEKEQALRFLERALDSLSEAEGGPTRA